MKTALTLLIILPLLLAACKKDHDDVDNGCMEQLVITKTDHTIDAALVSVVNNLFLRNGIDPGNFRYAGYSHGPQRTNYPPYTVYDQVVVRFDQYVNGLCVFNNVTNCIFWNDTIQYYAPLRMDLAGLDRSPHLPLNRLRKLFSDDLKTLYLYRLGSAFVDLSGTCFEAEFGYYNYGAPPGQPGKVVKAWRVKIKGHPDAPVAYYEDAGGKLIHFSTGFSTDV